MKKIFFIILSIISLFICINVKAVTLENGFNFNRDLGYVGGASAESIIFGKLSDYRDVISDSDYKNGITVDDNGTGSIKLITKYFREKRFNRQVTVFYKYVLTNTSEVIYLNEDCSYMFQETKTNKVDFSNVNSSKVKYMNYMFKGGSSYDPINPDITITDQLDISNLKTENVEDMTSMFEGSSYSSINFKYLDTSNAKYLSKMFYASSFLKTVNSDKGISIKNAIDLSAMFCWCNRIEKITFAGGKTAVDEPVDMSGMFGRCQNLSTIVFPSDFDTSHVETMQEMFTGCTNLRRIDLSMFDTSNVRTMLGMFSGCTKLDSINLSGFNTKKLDSTYYMFSDCESLTTLDLTSFDTSNLEYSYDMFKNCKNLKTIKVSKLWTNKNLKNTDIVEADGMFEGCYKLTSNYKDYTFKYSSSKVDQTYATINLGENHPGYFTLVGDEPTMILVGDLVKNGKIDNFDLIKYIRILVGMEKIDAYQPYEYNFDDNEELGTNDLISIIRIIVGLDNPKEITI